MTRKFLIYCGSGGVASTAARILHSRGDDLHLVGRNKDKMPPIAAELHASFTTGDEKDSSLFIQVAEDVGDDLDGLVYAVGTINLRRFQLLTEAGFLNDFPINALDPAIAAKMVFPALNKSMGGASFVLFSSVAIRQGFALHESIGMPKGAVNGLTLSLANELAPKVRVNAIAPSLTRPPLPEGILSHEQMAEQHALPRLDEPEKFAALTAFLLPPEAGWIKGQIIGVDGGGSTLRTKG